MNKNADFTLKDIIKSLLENDSGNEILLPNFQRNFVWTADSQKELIASFLLDLPIGSLLISEGKKNQYSYRKICFQKHEISEDSKGCKFLLDGQQRLSTLINAFTDLYVGKPENIKLVWSKLKYRWFFEISIKQGESSKVLSSLTDPANDIFGLKLLKFDSNSFNDIDTTEMLNYIESRKLGDRKRDKDEWYHPESQSTRPPADCNLLPLYRLDASSQSGHDELIDDVLKLISKRREDEIRSEYLASSEQDKREIEKIFSCKDSEDFQRNLQDRSSEWRAYLKSSLNEIFKKQLHSIVIDEKTFTIKGVNIFESLNRGGTRLNAFDLVSARYARLDEASEHSLSERIKSLLDELDKEHLPKHISSQLSIKVIDLINDKEGSHDFKNDFKDLFLKILSIVRAVPLGEEIKIDSIKEKHILSITSEDIAKHLLEAVTVFRKTIIFCHCSLGMEHVGKLPYKLMLLPIAKCFIDTNLWSVDNNKTLAEAEKKLNRIKYWFWTAIFSGLYRELQNQRCIEDIADLEEFVNGKKNPYQQCKIFEAPQYSDFESMKLNERTNVSKSLFMYILSCRPRDLSPDPIDLSVVQRDHLPSDQNSLETHHIIPKKQIEKASDDLINSPLNETKISKRANRDITNDKKYLSDMSNVAKESFRDHFIPDTWREIDKELNSLKHQDRTSLDNFLTKCYEERFNLIKTSIEEQLKKLL
jgi:hypothetical protein